MKKPSRGFTIVELLIVIVVIGILAAITIVSFNGVQKRAANTARETELRSWQKVFEVYKAANNGVYPGPATGAECLGENFPVGSGGVRRCRSLSDDAYSYQQTANAATMTQIKTIANLPNSSRTPVGAFIGPFAFYDTSIITLVGVFSAQDAASSCPSGLTYTPSGNADVAACTIILTR
ncbi:MAG: prepilin-type N-terminal cleavage/methylation domain-containing protein [Chloroflexi bacterium]|nr:MAG: prepilin-type N-terminal cleavage/methylation domain-containing protein [Chloroflexota bacterium]